MHAGPGLHCRPGPVAATNAWRPDPIATARSAFAAHQPPYRAGGPQDLNDCGLPSAWAMIVCMHVNSHEACYLKLCAVEFSMLGEQGAAAFSRLGPLAHHAMARIHVGARHCCSCSVLKAL